MKVTVNYEQGDVVFLNSDMGLEYPMTVEDVTTCECGIDNVDVVFFNAVGELTRDSFPASCVMSLD